MRHLSLAVALLTAAASAQDAAPKLNLIVVEGEGAINNVRQRTAREPIVQVEDENHKPIAGAAVVFLLPSDGPGGVFANGSHSLTVMTDSQGRAVAHGLRPNNVQGHFQIHVNASYNGQTASTTISQSNAVVAGAAATGAVSGKLIAILAVAGAAVAGGLSYYFATRGGNNTPANAPTTIMAGSGTAGAPR